MGQHSGARVVLITLTAIVWVVMVVFNGLAGGAGQKIGIFKNTTGDISDVYILQITPAGWTFSIWGVIYAWQALWILYSMTAICRQTAEGNYIYTLPVMPPVLFVVYIINNLSNIAWLFLWDRQQLVWSIIVIALTPITLYICLFFSYRRLYNNLKLLIQQKVRKDIWLIRFLVQNGLAIYAAWTTVATLLSVAMGLIYEGHVEKMLACTIVLGILSFVIVLWFILDNVFLDKYTRYTFTPYVTFVWALAGSVSKNFDLDNTKVTSIFLAVLLGVACVLLLLKIVNMVVRHIRKPIEPRLDYEPTI